MYMFGSQRGGIPIDIVTVSEARFYRKGVSHCDIEGGKLQIEYLV